MIEFILAFGAGLLSFLSPCVLPLIPGYISYISGSTLNELLEKKTVNIFPIILFAVGFSIVFISFGATATFRLFSIRKLLSTQNWSWNNHYNIFFTNIRTHKS